MRGSLPVGFGVSFGVSGEVSPGAGAPIQSPKSAPSAIHVRIVATSAFESPSLLGGHQVGVVLVERDQLIERAEVGVAWDYDRTRARPL